MRLNPVTLPRYASPASSAVAVRAETAVVKSLCCLSTALARRTVVNGESRNKRFPSRARSTIDEAFVV